MVRDPSLLSGPSEFSLDDPISNNFCDVSLDFLLEIGDFSFDVFLRSEKGDRFFCCGGELLLLVVGLCCWGRGVIPLSLCSDGDMMSGPRVHSSFLVLKESMVSRILGLRFNQYSNSWTKKEGIMEGYRDGRECDYGYGGEECDALYLQIKKLVGYYCAHMIPGCSIMLFHKRGGLYNYCAHMIR